MEEESEDKSLSLARISVRTGAHKFLFAYKCEKLFIFSRRRNKMCGRRRKKMEEIIYFHVSARRETRRRVRRSLYFCLLNSFSITLPFARSNFTTNQIRIFSSAEKVEELYFISFHLSSFTINQIQVKLYIFHKTCVFHDVC